MKKTPFLLNLTLAVLLSGCATAIEPPPYPAFVVTDELQDIFLATLPGVRAKEFAGDARTRSVSNRIDLPESWTGTTGGEPGKALEVFVLAGELSFADISLVEGGYAFVPPGSIGFSMKTDEGARVLYFLNDHDGQAVIRTPLIIDSDLIDWQPTDTIGVFTKELRYDPGSQSRTWLMRIEPEAQIPWQASSALLEGYLVSGQFQDSECVVGGPYTGTYQRGGYFRRPANAIHGGPEAKALTESIWFLREHRKSKINYDVDCAVE